MCNHLQVKQWQRDYYDLDDQHRYEIIKWCCNCGCLFDYEWVDGMRIQRWISPRNITQNNGGMKNDSEESK